MNPYYYKVKLPVYPVVREFAVDDLCKNNHQVIDPRSDVTTEFINWFELMGLYWISGGYFYTPALSRWSPHIDGHTLTDFCKINWCSGGGKNSAKWYTPKENFKLVPEVPRSVNSKYFMISPDQVDLAYETVHAENCLFNAGRIHSFDSGQNAQHVVSVVLGRKKTNKVIIWDEALEVFADYIVDSNVPVKRT
jgi:hypothetical protein